MTDRFGIHAPDASATSATGTATAASNSSNATGARTDAAGLPSFGFVSAAASANATSATTSSTPSTAAAAVPISGLAVAITSRAQAGSNQFDIRLDPPELGRIDVRLDVDGSGQVTTHVTAERADTLQLLQSQQPQIENALQQAGLKTADNGLQFTLRDQSFNGQNNGGSGSQNNGTAQLVIPDADLKPITATQIYARAGLGSGLDIRV
jgi:flagellar hook-length control protein FliK